MKTLKVVVISAFAGQITAILFLLLMGAFVKKSDDPLSYTSVTVYLSVILSSLLCGTLATLLAEEKKVLCVVLSDGAAVGLSLLLSFLPGGGQGAIGPVILLLLRALLPFVPWIFLKKSGNERRNMRKKAKRRYSGR